MDDVLYVGKCETEGSGVSLDQMIAIYRSNTREFAITDVAVPYVCGLLDGIHRFEPRALLVNGVPVWANTLFPQAYFRALSIEELEGLNAYNVVPLRDLSVALEKANDPQPHRHHFPRV